jgi:hypothetical protein
VKLLQKYSYQWKEGESLEVAVVVVFVGPQEGLVDGALGIHADQFAMEGRSGI